MRSLEGGAFPFLDDVLIDPVRKSDRIELGEGLLTAKPIIIYYLLELW